VATLVLSAALKWAPTAENTADSSDESPAWGRPLAGTRKRASPEAGAEGPQKRQAKRPRAPEVRRDAQERQPVILDLEHPGRLPVGGHLQRQRNPRRPGQRRLDVVRPMQAAPWEDAASDSSSGEPSTEFRSETTSDAGSGYDSEARSGVRSAASSRYFSDDRTVYYMDHQPVQEPSEEELEGSGGVLGGPFAGWDMDPDGNLPGFVEHAAVPEDAPDILGGRFEEWDLDPGGNLPGYVEHWAVPEEAPGVLGGPFEEWDVDPGGNLPGLFQHRAVPEEAPAAAGPPTDGG
jgi:hypothetical protein